MSADEFLSFIPLLLYGIALADLFSQWRRFFEKQYLYLPYVITTIVFTEIAIWNVFIFMEFLEVIPSVSYYEYWLFLLQPIIFLLMVHAFTPEVDNIDTETYFKRRMGLVFLLMAVYIGTHMLPSLTTRSDFVNVRVVTVVVCLAIAISRKIWLIYLMGALWVVSLFFRDL